MKRIIIVLACLGSALLGWAVYRQFFKPPESYKQTAEKITNIEIYNPEDVVFIGIKAMGWKIGLSRPLIKKMDEVTREVDKVK